MDRFIFLAFCFVLAFPTVGLVLVSEANGKILLPIGLLALFAGLIFEYRRIDGNWYQVLWTTLSAYGTSFLAFMPHPKNRHYSFEDRIQIWPFVFCSILAIAVITQHKKRVTAHLHEGITLLQTMSILYLVTDINVFSYESHWKWVLITPLTMFSSFALLNALLPVELSNKNRFWLSIWSSLITVSLAADHVRRVYALGMIEGAHDPMTIGIIALNYFLLGTVFIYIAQNIIMLVNFLPGEGAFFNRAYFRQVRALRKEHIQRYDAEQLNPALALICLLFAATIFGLNYTYKWVPSSTAIWAVFLTFPWFLSLTRHIWPHQDAPARPF